MDDGQLVGRLYSDLADRLGQQRFDLWFGTQALFATDGDILRVRVPSAFVRDCIRKNFQGDLQQSCSDVLQKNMDIVYEVDGSVLLPSKRPGVGQTVPDTSKDSRSCEPPSVLSIALLPNPKKTRLQESFKPKSGCNKTSFDSLVIGRGNRFAATSAKMLAEGVHQASPVLFWGSTGVGKTHLLKSIHNAARRKVRTVFLTAEQFTTGFIEAVRGSGLPSFRQKCRGADLLILDDIHFFQNKRATLEELLHTIDTITSSGKQIVVACDRSISELQAIGPELVSRLSAGAICEIEPPDFSMRRQLVTQLASSMSLALEQNVVEAIAMQVTAGGRELQGALNRLKLTSSVLDRSVDLQMVEESLTELLQNNIPRVRLADIQRAVCDTFGVEPASLRSEAKVRAVTEPRMLAMWLARKYTRAPWSEIGQFFGKRSHSTVISAHRRLEKLMHDEQTIHLVDRPCQVEDAIRKVETALRRA